MDLPRDLGRELAVAAWRALTAAGERECPAYVSKSTGRKRYLPGYHGYFRLLTTSNTPVFKLERKIAPAHWHLGVGHADNSRKQIMRYAEILRAAGFTVHVCGTHRHPTAIRAYVDAPWSYDSEIETAGELAATDRNSDKV